MTTGAGPPSIRYFPPAPALKGFVSSYYLFEVRAPFVRDVMRAETAQIRFVLEGRGAIGYGDGAWGPMPRASIAGPSLSASRFEIYGPFRLWGVGLTPAGWAALIGEEADRYADRVVELDGLAPALVLSVWAELAEASGPDVWVAATDRLLSALARRARPVPFWLTRTTDRWLTEHDDPDVNRLVAELGMSNRQVERLVRRHYGASPKLIARKFRALKAAVRLGLDPEGGWQAAAGCAFYDQSHFIREFRRFVGLTPGRFLARDPSMVSHLTIAERARAPELPALLRLS
ncbi:MAG: AraC family transcriptional regulator [Sphingomonadaceae bacterium]|uniref:AraC family transcriptional regulator n=1 Tax=Thermaurantiacus sp. TaxID=2820283 RepID=UPI00298F2F3E|nr:AraC family transcriptional regulator [Thermaurantiacus sp.]MCS6987369.1 AraC family transcriptional regulator [Sphingomonadaceae bacterium]MDW8415286.1 AraC family transcriptional regulator [Thermaurantiacus sp.]